MDKDLLKFPFQSGPVIANLIFALLFWFFQSIASVAGPFGAAVIPAYVILILLYSHYAIDVVLAAGTDDYIGGIGTPIIPSEFKGDSISGKIELNDLTIIGANSVILPNVKVGKGRFIYVDIDPVVLVG